jgi:hypothetical protein
MPFNFLKMVQKEIENTGATMIIQGGAQGADALASCAAFKLGIPQQTFFADWNTYGKRAGPLRNQKMLEQKPDLVLAFYPETGITKGTLDMVSRAKAAGILVKEIQYKEEIDN